MRGPDASSSRRAADLIAELGRVRGRACRCGVVVCGHHHVMSIVLGCRHEPRCADCLAQGLGREPDELRAQVMSWVRRHDCYRAAWQWTNTAEVDCAAALDLGSVDLPDDDEPLVDESLAVEPAFDAEWDAGDMGCGELLAELRLRLRELEPGRVFLVVSRDSGAPRDLPAWCRLTGHGLVAAAPPRYFIRRKDS